MNNYRLQGEAKTWMARNTSRICDSASPNEEEKGAPKEGARWVPLPKVGAALLPPTKERAPQ